MAGGKSLDNLVGMLPVDTDEIISKAVAAFFSRQDPDNIKFNQYENGYQIQVFTDEEKAIEAREFWEQNVHGKIEEREDE